MLLTSYLTLDSCLLSTSNFPIIAFPSYSFANSSITEHDKKIAQKTAYVMCGGDLSQPSFVSERYLLELEREAVVSLCGEPKTLERMHGILFKRKTIRN